MTTRKGGAHSPSFETSKQQRYCAWFHELDAWTEYWDVYHPETRGRFYFGDGNGEPGLLRQFVPREHRPASFLAWRRKALLAASDDEEFANQIQVPDTAAAIMEVDVLLAQLFTKRFGDANDEAVRNAYLEAVFLFATDTLPPACLRDALIPEDDPRKGTAGRHSIEGDLMWFAWALHTEAADLLGRQDGGRKRRALFLAGIAMGCAANFAWRGHRRTRSEYDKSDKTARLLHERGGKWACELETAAAEVHALYRIREWGQGEDG